MKSIYEKVREKYPELQYPSRSHFKIYVVPNVFENKFSEFKNLDEAILYAESIGLCSKQIIQKFDEVTYKSVLECHHKREADIHSEYKSTMIRYHGVSEALYNHIMSKAYEERHEEGYYAIEEEFEDLLDFVLKANRIIEDK